MRLFPHSKRVKTKLLNEFKEKKILDLGLRPNSDLNFASRMATVFSTGQEINHDLKTFPWPIPDNTFDLIICQHVLEYLPNTSATLEELNRIAAPGGKIYIETPHYTWYEAYRHHQHSHLFSLGSFDYFLKGNPYYKTDFIPIDKYLFFDDLTFMLGIGFLANYFPKIYEKRFAFIFPATSFHVTFHVEK